MASAPSGPPAPRASPQPNVYTVLLLVAVAAAVVTLVVVLRALLAPMPGGYGLELKDLFAS
jgi:hypothetical protein